MSSQKETVVPLKQWIDDREKWAQLIDYMLEESHLPGPRANLGLSDRFAKLFAHSDITETAWELLLSWANIISVETENIDPREFLPFCAIVAAGAYHGYAEEERCCIIEGIIKSATNDQRWRVREAAAMALQRIGEDNFETLRRLLDMWRMEASELEQRAFVAALAHPPLLKKKENVLYCLNLASGIMEGILSGDRRGEQGDPEHYRVLSKGLEYSLSVFVAHEPEAGFAMLRRFAESGEPRMIKIVKSNLGKSRLSKKYGPEVADILTGLTKERFP